MSIPNILHKIKGKIGIDKVAIVYLFIIIGVGISSFSLGRLSMNDTLIENNNIATAGTNKIFENKITNNESSFTTQPQPQEKGYVASKNGKMYYTKGCSGANRIKPENEVWFSTELEAEKSGYTKSSLCK